MNIDTISEKISTVNSISTNVQSSTNPIYNGLSTSDILLLEQQGNTAKDWSTVYISNQSVQTLSITINSIQHCSFSGSVYIGQFDKSDISIDIDTTAKSGLYYSNFYGTCIIGDNCYIAHNFLLKNVFIETCAVVVQCMKIKCNSASYFGNYQTLQLGSESSVIAQPKMTRNVTIHADLKYSQLCEFIFPWFDNTRTSSNPSTFINNSNMSNTIASTNSSKETKFPGCAMTIIGAHSSIINCSEIDQCYIGNSSCISNSQLHNTTILSTQRQPTLISDAIIRDSIVSNACKISANSTLNKVFMYSHSSITQNALVVDSILAPDASICLGECYHSLLGPHVGFHHTSLLISTLWLFGKGNISYGAKIGANHSGRANDQECWMGEGRRR